MMIRLYDVLIYPLTIVSASLFDAEICHAFEPGLSSSHASAQWDFVKRFVTRFVVFQVQTVFIPSAQRIEIEPLLIFQVLIWQKHMSGHRDSLVAKSFLIIMLSL